MSFSKVLLAATLCFTVLAPSKLTADTLPIGEKDSKDNVVFTTIVENLPLKQSEAYAAALDYLNNEYKTAQYSDIREFQDKGIAVGASTLNSFYTASGLLASDLYSADYHLRFDCKDNKVRVQVIFSDYQQIKLNDNGNKETALVKICSVSPFQDSKNKKHYKNAYAKLQEFVGQVLSSVKSSLQSAAPAPEMEEW